MNEENTPENKMKKMQQDKNLTPKQVDILHAAIELFAKKGYFNTSTSEIAKLAGVAEGTIFRHYRTKKELLKAVLAPAIVDFTATYFVEQFIEEAVHTSHKNMRSFLDVFIRNRFAFAAENTPAVRILLQELAFHPDMQAIIKHVFKTKMYPQLNKVLTYFKERGGN
ncbi:TetR family transcriptional regulator [Virgibacillus halophilus]|uniref:TetR family transcriptional regulator n=1 Tax=Tigheibacillus halophilus TaxID=361280 RepID=A0ABU5C4C7_9BACI|nr:TetR family transcriptional regulator [Virgibacillus halophilus]